MKFDPRPRGWSSYSGDHPYRGGCCTTWMIPEFRTRALDDYNALEAALRKLTKRQLVDFLEEGGRTNFCGLVSRESLILTAHCDQYYAWYPYVEEVA
jgi:hypothetical protein